MRISCGQRFKNLVAFWAAVLPLVSALDASTCEGASSVIEFPKGVSVEVLKSRDGDFLGIGAVMIENIRMSPSERPMRIEIVGRDDKYDLWRKPQPIEYEARRLTRIEHRGDCAAVNVDLLHADGSVDKLQIIFELVEDMFYESPAVGIRYHFRWSSDTRYAHQIRETSWWSFGDSVDGLRWIAQCGGYGRSSIDFVVRDGMHFGGFLPSYDSPKYLTAAQIAEARERRKGDKDNPYRFQYLLEWEARETRQGNGDYVTFASREKDNVSFLRYADTPGMSYWQMERVEGESEVRFEEWYCERLASVVQTTPIVAQVLHKAGVNAWIDAHEIVKARLLAAAGMPHQDPLPWVAYTQQPIDDPNALKRQIPYDKALKVMRDAGIKEYWWYGPWQSNWSEIARMTKEEIKKHSPIYGHSVWDYDWAYKKFDVRGFGNLVSRSRREGIGPVIWATQTMSQCSPHVYAHPDWALRRPDGSLFNYVYNDLVGMNHGSGYSDFFVNRIALRRREMAFDGLWLDSFCFSACQIDWMDPDLTPNFMAALETMKKLRAIGVKRIYTEAHVPFAISSVGGYVKRDMKRSGEKSYLLYDTAPVDHLGDKDLKATPEVYFKHLAFKSCPQPYLRHYVNHPDFMRSVSYVNKAYVKALPFMSKCVVLEGDRGTLYWSDDRRKAVVFSFVNGAIDVGRRIAAAKEVLRATPCEFHGARLSADAQTVYLLDVK